MVEYEYTESDGFSLVNMLNEEENDAILSDARHRGVFENIIENNIGILTPAETKLYNQYVYEGIMTRVDGMGFVGGGRLRGGRVSIAGYEGINCGVGGSRLRGRRVSMRGYSF